MPRMHRGQGVQSEHVLSVRGVETPAELRAANVLMARTQLPAYKHSIRWLETVGAGWPGYSPDFTRVAIAQDEIVGALRLIEISLRIGRAKIRAGGIGWVSTAPTHRNRGVCSALMQDTMSLMKKRGFALSLLFAIPGLYHRFGYVTAIPEYSVTVEANTSRVGDVLRFRTRRATLSDIPTLARIHDAHEASASCSLVRNHALLRSQFASSMNKTPYWSDWPKARLVLSDRGNTIAYLMPQVSENELHIKELGTTTSHSCDCVLQAALRIARTLNKARVRFHVPPYHPMSRYLECIESIHEARHFEDREGMFALVDAEKCLESMLPEWRRNLADAHLANASGEFTLGIDKECFRICFGGTNIRVLRGRGKKQIRLTSGEFVRLVTGYIHPEHFPPADVLSTGGLPRALFNTMFAKRSPFVWPIDHF